VNGGGRGGAVRRLGGQARRSGHADRPDDELVWAARDGDAAALDTLLRRHQPRLLVLCRRITGDPTDAEDACQEALIALARGIRRFDGRSAFRTWAYRVTTNTCLDELRRRRRRPVPSEDAIAGPERGGLPTLRSGTQPALRSGKQPGLRSGTQPAATDDPGDGIAARLDVDAALAAIAPDFRAAVVLRDLCQLSYDEIAEVLDVPPGTVRSRIARGRAALLPLLGNSPPPGERRTS
jgi:RNA polymerase sigma-70 factor, ECF subfamily